MAATGRFPGLSPANPDTDHGNDCQRCRAYLLPRHAPPRTILDREQKKIAWFKTPRTSSAPSSRCGAGKNRRAPRHATGRGRRSSRSLFSRFSCSLFSCSLGSTDSHGTGIEATKDHSWPRALLPIEATGCNQLEKKVSRLGATIAIRLSGREVLCSANDPVRLPRWALSKLRALVPELRSHSSRPQPPLRLLRGNRLPRRRA